MCSTPQEEQAVFLAPSEAKFSAKRDLVIFSAFDLASQVTGWPITLSLTLYDNRFVSWRATRSFFSAKL